MCISLVPTECKRLFLKSVGIYWQTQEILVLIVLVSKQVSVRPKHMCSPTRALAACIHQGLTKGYGVQIKYQTSSKLCREMVSLICCCISQGR